ncbi:hypothetical protein [Aquimarina aquimarini]|uniref:hypothetical protein n=1 Tax=Aquimarina aquimarini TaxID=1191734 RepID=UPI000D555CF6|nr:hypothetical protein [Aquimarina aquimarini]
MKTLITILVSFIIGVLTSNAQTNTIISTEKSTQEVEEEDNYYRSFAVIDTDKNFKIKIKFVKKKKDNVKIYLIDQLGEENMMINVDEYSWKKGIDGEELYTVQLKENRLRINVDKELASDKIIKKFKLISAELKLITSRSSKN